MNTILFSILSFSISLFAYSNEASIDISANNCKLTSWSMFRVPSECPNYLCNEEVECDSRMGKISLNLVCNSVKSGTTCPDIYECMDQRISISNISKNEQQNSSTTNGATNAISK